MGLAGPMVVMPEGDGNRLYAGGPAFDRQYTLVLHELDDRVNRAVASGGNFDMSGYEPNYFFVNGLSYPNTTADEETLISMNVGDRVALRFVKSGLITNPMHFHGYHVEVATRNRQVETSVIDKDTVLVANRAPRRSATTTLSRDPRQTQRILALRHPRYETR